jgi:hypothetical protein
MPLDQLAAYAVGVHLHGEDLAAHIAGAEPIDPTARAAELLPDYRASAAEVT